MDDRKVASGQPLRIPASTYNAFVDAARAFQASKHDIRVSGRPDLTTPAVIRLRNATEATVSQFGVLALGDSVLDPTENLGQFRQHVVVEGNAPAGTGSGRFAILRQPIKAGKVGWAVVAGVTPCRLTVTVPEYTLADVVDTETTSIQTSLHGDAEILWREDVESGECWAVVRIGATQGTHRRFELAEELVGGSDDEAVNAHPILDVGAGPVALESATIEVVNRFGQFSGVAGKRGYMDWLADTLCWEITQLECP